jgi:membrane protein required for colicin V production
VVGTVSEEWLRSEELQAWVGRIIVFGVVLAFGGLLGWGIAKLVQLSALSGVDRFMGSLFGAARGVVLVSVAVIGAQFAGFDNDDWWMQSRLIPHLEAVADWIKVMAPEGLDMIVPDGEAESLPGDSPVEV